MSIVISAEITWKDCMQDHDSPKSHSTYSATAQTMPEVPPSEGNEMNHTFEMGVKSSGIHANAAAVSELEAHLGYWLRFVSTHVSHSFQKKPKPMA